MSTRGKKAAIIGAAVLLVGCVYALVLSRTGYGIPCVFRLVTGLKCPGCGVSHMLLGLLRLDFAAAFASNAVLLCLSPVLLVLFALWIFRFVRYESPHSGKTEQVCVRILIGILLAWGVVRNLIGM